jgi:hypothetical protein
MNAHPIVHAFPDRAIALAPDPAATKRRRLQLAGVLLLFVPLIWFGYSTLHTRALRADLRTRGVPAEVLSAEGSCLSRRGITGDSPRGCNLDIRYRTRDGGAERTASVYLPGAAPLVFAPPVLYDPEDPGRVMTKADVERGDPFMNLAVPLAAFTLIPLVALLVWFATGDGQLKRAAAAPRPTIVPVLRATRDKQGRLAIVFPRPGGGPDGRALFATGEPLLVTPPAGAPAGSQWAAALLTAKDWPILLDQDLARLDLTPDERDAILRAARG